MPCRYELMYQSWNVPADGHDVFSKSEIYSSTNANIPILIITVFGKIVHLGNVHLISYFGRLEVTFLDPPIEMQDRTSNDYFCFLNSEISEL